MNYKPFPPYIRGGKGARVWDVDGNEYIDWQLSFGCLPMGHAHPKIVEVIQREVAAGTHFATALEVEVETAELMVSMLPHVDKVRFAKTPTWEQGLLKEFLMLMELRPLRNMTALLIILVTGFIYLSRKACLNKQSGTPHFTPPQLEESSFFPV